MASHKREKRVEWYQKRPDSTWGGYVKKLVLSSIQMYPRARIYGWRYYWDKQFRAASKLREHNKRRKKLYGSGYLSKTSLHKDRLIYRRGSICNICKFRFPKEKLTIDHILPVSKGGTSIYANLQLLCVPCHIVKDTELNKPVISPFKEAFNRIYAE